MLDSAYKIHAKCDMLINQNVYIGEDPIGHCCMNDATHEGQGFLFCQKCRDNLGEGNTEWRVSFPARGSAKTWKKDVQKTVDRILTEG